MSLDQDKSCLAEYLESDFGKSQGLNTFWALENALNQVLRDKESHNLHPRYAQAREIGSIGLALAVDIDGLQPDQPFSSQEYYRLPAFYSNREESLESQAAWKPADEDKERLGVTLIPEILGRFGTFAVAKLEVLRADSRLLSSHMIDISRLEPGKFGNAGGIRTHDSLEAVSGLWEVHDYVIAKIFAYMMSKLWSGNTSLPESSDILAEKLESIFSEIRLKHKGTLADDLTRLQVHDLLPEADRIVGNKYQSFAA